MNSKIFLSAGHDGNLFIWNVTTGELTKKYYNAVSLAADRQISNNITMRFQSVTIFLLDRRFRTRSVFRC